MRKFVMICVVVLLLSSSAFAQQDTLWTRTFGGAESDGGRSICMTADGGFIITGYTYSEGEGHSDLYLIKTDSEGNQEWANTYGGSGWEYGNSVCQVSSTGGYVVVGYTSSWGAGSKEVLFVKFDSHGNMEQVNTFGHTGIEVGMSVCEADDGGFMICGYTNSFGNGEFDVYVIKTDSDGNGEWAEMYGGALTDIGNAIIKTSSGNYVINGSSGTYGAGNMNFWMFEIDSEGEQQWAQNFGLGSDFDWGKGICETADGGFALVGDSDTHGADLLDVMLIKTDDYGFEDWRYKISRSVFYDYGNSICQTSDGGFIICGATKYTNTQKNDIYMIRTNSNGNVLWTGTYGGSESDWGSSMCITNDDDYVIVGHTESFGAGKYDVYLMKLQGDPVSVDEDETLIPESASLEQNYPNPFNNKTTITFSVKENEEAQLEIYDLYGRLVRTFMGFDTGSHNVIWDGTDNAKKEVSSGLYFYKLKTSSNTSVRRMLLLK